jgi:hypothetical protein
MAVDGNVSRSMLHEVSLGTSRYFMKQYLFQVTVV